MHKAQNVGAVERWLRIVGGGIIVVLGLMVLHPSPESIAGAALGVVLVALGGDFVYTGMVGYCPLYQMLGWSTAAPVDARRIRPTEHIERHMQPQEGAPSGREGSSGC